MVGGGLHACKVCIMHGLHVLLLNNKLVIAGSPGTCDDSSAPRLLMQERRVLCRAVELRKSVFCGGAALGEWQ